MPLLLYGDLVVGHRLPAVDLALAPLGLQDRQVLIGRAPATPLGQLVVAGPLGPIGEFYRRVKNGF